MPSPAFYPTYVCLLFSALPMMIGTLGLTAIGVLGRFALVSKSWAWADVMLIALIVSLAGVAWGVKGFFSPTRSRTPPGWRRWTTESRPSVRTPSHATVRSHSHADERALAQREQRAALTVPSFSGTPNKPVAALLCR